MRLLLFALLISTASFAQKKTYTLADMPFVIDSTTGGLVYRGVVEVPNATSDELYTRAKAFLLKAFTNDSPVIQTDDKSAELIAAKGKYSIPLSLMAMAFNDNNQIYYECPIEIRVKDGRYRYEISNLELVSRGMRFNIDNMYKKRPHVYDKMNENHYRRYTEKDPIKDMVNRLKKAMETKTNNDF